MSRAHSIDRRAGRNGARRRPEQSGRSRRQAIPRPHGHAGERLSRRTARRIEPAASVGPNALDARPAFRHFSPGGAGVQPGQERLLDLSHRANATQPGGQGIPRTQTGAPHRRFASNPGHARTERHPACGHRDRKSDRHRLSHGPARSHRQPRPSGIERREALRGAPPAMFVLRPQEAARPEPCAGAGRVRCRRKARHDQRRVPHRFAEGHGCALPKARQPPHRRGLASRTDRSRPALEYQLLCHAQFLGARQDGQ